MRIRQQDWIAGCVLLGALASVPAEAVDREQALRLAGEGRCAAATDGLETAFGADPGDAEVARLLGRCRVRAGRYADAVTALRAAQERRPDDAALALDLAIASYHQGDLASARDALAAAERLGAGRPELPLYQGLVALDQADDAAAARLLDRARALGGDDLEPVVSYYGGLAWSRAGDRSAAREALERVVANWPGTDWAEQAALALGRLGEAENDLFGFLRVGIERDDNVVLRGRGVRLPDEIGRDRDERLVWNGSLGSHLVEDGRDTIGAALAYSGNAHEDLDRFDTHFPSVIVWWDRVLASGWTSRVLGGAGYAWVDDAPFLLETRLGTSLHRELPRGARATLSTELYRHDFRFSNDDVFDGPGTPGAPCPGGATVLCGPPGIDESTARNRDGLGWIVALEGVQPLWAEAELFAGASYQRFDARGQEYSFSARSVSLGLQTPLAYGVELEVSARLTWRPYRNPTTFPEPDGLVAGQQYALRGTDRRERELRTDVALVRPLNETLTVETRWTYERNRSTASVFDTRRHVLGAYLTASFGS